MLATLVATCASIHLSNCVLVQPAGDGTATLIVTAVVGLGGAVLGAIVTLRASRADRSSSDAHRLADVIGRLWGAADAADTALTDYQISVAQIAKARARGLNAPEIHVTERDRAQLALRRARLNARLALAQIRIQYPALVEAATALVTIAGSRSPNRPENAYAQALENFEAAATTAVTKLAKKQR